WCTIEAKLQFRGKTLRGRFLVDTGAPGFELIVAAQFARRHALGTPPAASRIEAPGLCVRTAMGRLRGKARIQMDGLPALEIAPFVSLDQKGVLADGSIDGVIGGDLLRRFGTIVIDLPQRRILVRR